MNRRDDRLAYPIVDDNVRQIGSQSSLRGGATIETQLIEKAEALSRERKARRRITGRHGRFFHGPAWTILLALFVLRSKDVTPAVTAVSYDLEIPVSTCLRWIRELDDAGLVASHVDGVDARVRRVQLTDEAVAMVMMHLA